MKKINKQASLLIQNAHVYTVDDDNPAAEAVAIRGNEIIFVGTTAAAQQFVGDKTRVVEGRGRSLLPGFIDSHFHLAWGSQTLVGAQLYAIESLDHLKTALENWQAENPALPWVLGQGMPYSLPTPDKPLTRHHLDAIEPNKPVALTTFDMHSMFVNTAALEIMGLMHGAPEPLANGEVVIADDGLATGELYEMDAMDYVYRAIPEPGPEQTIEILKRGLALCARHGLTSVHNMDGDIEQAQLYAAMEDSDALTLRVYIPYWVRPGMTMAQMESAATAMRDSHQSDKVRSNCVKFFMDGVYESYTAVSLTGYPDQPDNFGEPIWDAQSFARFAAAADRLGLQIFVHACGDGAVRRVLDGYEAAQRVNGRRDSRHRVEHIEMIDLADVPRFKELGVVASMQPLHAPLQENDPDVWAQRVKPSDWDRAFAWRTLREAGVPLVFGSDWPVAPPNPIEGIWGAVNRQALAADGKSHAQTLAESICAYTRDAAFAEFQEDKKGQIKVGMWADLVLLSDDIFAVPMQQIKDVDVKLTVCNGRITYNNL